MSVIRCVGWVSAGLQARAQSAEQPFGPGSPQGSVLGVPPPAGGPNPDGAAPPLAAGPASWGPGCSQEALNLLAADLVALQGAVEGPLAGAMLAALEPLPPDVATSMQVGAMVCVCLGMGAGFSDLSFVYGARLILCGRG